MSRALGDSLPDVLHELLDGHDLAARMGHAILRDWQSVVDGLRREA